MHPSPIDSNPTTIVALAADEYSRVRERPQPGPGSAAPPIDGLVALLVTDLEQFTAIVQRLGDLSARSLIRAHNRLLRGCLHTHCGTEITHTGDGLIAAFRSIARALACATQIQHELEAFSASNPTCRLRVRIGIHAGEPLAEEGRLFGTCVNAAVRVCSAAAASRVLVSDVVCALAAGQPFCFAPLGLVPLAGLDRPMQLSELLWRRGPSSIDRS